MASSGIPALTKRQLRWAGITTAVFFVLDIAVIILVTLWEGTVSLTPTPGLVLAEAIILVLAFSMFRISRSLVPTSKFE